jgi:flagellar hook assembly protein FlgD
MEIGSATNQVMDYMTLLITELQNQNPLEPLDNQQMAQQLAQFSQLEMTEEMNNNIETMNSTMGTMNSTFQGTLLMAELDYARSLLGKQVTFYSNDYDQIITGQVRRINIIDNKPNLEVHGKTILTDGTESDELSFPVRLNEIAGIKD